MISLDNAWSNKNFLYYLTFRMLQHTSSEVNGYNGYYVGKTKRRKHDRKTEHFKALSQGCRASALADHVTSTGHNFKWDHFDILATGTKVQLTVQN